MQKALSRQQMKNATFTLPKVQSNAFFGIAFPIAYHACRPSEKPDRRSIITPSQPHVGVVYGRRTERIIVIDPENRRHRIKKPFNPWSSGYRGADLSSWRQ